MENKPQNGENAQPASRQDEKRVQVQNFMGFPCAPEEAKKFRNLLTELQLRTGGKVAFTIGINELLCAIRVLQIGLSHPLCAGNHAISAWIVKETMIAMCEAMAPEIGEILHRGDCSVLDGRREELLKIIAQRHTLALPDGRT